MSFNINDILLFLELKGRYSWWFFLLLSFILGAANNTPGVKSGQQETYLWPERIHIFTFYFFIFHLFLLVGG